MSNTSTNILDIKNIEVMYDNVILAIHDVSLKVPKGKVVALLGANGAGTVSYTHLTLPTNREV